MAQRTFEEIFEEKLAELRGHQKSEGPVEVLEEGLEVPSFIRTDYFEKNERNSGVPFHRVLYVDFLENEAAQDHFRATLMNTEASDEEVARAGLDCGLRLTALGTAFHNSTNLIHLRWLGILSYEQVEQYLLRFVKKFSSERVQHLELTYNQDGTARFQFDIARSILKLEVPGMVSQISTGRIPILGNHSAAREWVNELLNFDLSDNLDVLVILNLIFPEHQLTQLRAAIQADPARFESMTSEQLWLTLMRPQKLEAAQGVSVELAETNEPSDLVNWDQFPRVREGLRQAVFKILAQNGEVQVTPLHPEPEGTRKLCEMHQDELERYNKSGLWTRISKPDPRAPYWSLKVPEPVLALHRTMWDLVREEQHASDLERCSMGREEWLERALFFRAHVATWMEFLPVAVADTEFALTMQGRGGSYTPDWVARQAIIGGELDAPMQIGVSEIRAAIADASAKHGATREVLALVKKES